MEKHNTYPKVTTCLLAILLVACTDDFNSKDGDGAVHLKTMPGSLPSPVTEMPAFYKASVERNLQNFDRYIGTYGGHSVYLNFQMMLRDEALFIAPSLGVPSNFDYSGLYNLTIPVTTPNQVVLPSQVSGTSGVFDSEKLYYLDKYFGQMYNAVGVNVATKIRNTIISEIEADFHDWAAIDEWQLKSSLHCSILITRLCP